MVNLANAPEITEVRLRVAAVDLPDTLWFSLTIIDGEARGTASVPAGTQRTFTLQALDSDRRVLYEGSATVDVMVGVNPPLRIVMRSVQPTGEVPIVGQIGTYTIELTPADASLGVGGQLVIAAVVRDPWGRTVAGALPVWESRSPTIASVDAGGTVRGLTVGQAIITARFGAARADATIEVVATAPSPDPAPQVDTLFGDSFESGALGDAGRWQDITGTGRSMITASVEGLSAVSGTRVLKLATGGGAMTHFVSTGTSSPYDRLHLSFWLYRTSAYEDANPGLRAGGIRGSTTQWGSFGVGYGTPGSCPDDPTNVHQQEFMFAYVANDAAWRLRTYTNWLGQQKLTEDPPTCGGSYAIGSGHAPPATYHDIGFVPTANAWHRYEIEVRLNDVGQSNGWQRIWVDGVLKVEHLGVEYRTTSTMKLWGVTIDTGRIAAGALYVDDVLVSTSRVP